MMGLAKSVGSLDPRLAPVAGFDYRDREVVDMLALFKGDKPTTSFALSFAQATIPALIDSINIENLVLPFVGILGLTEEIDNSGEELIRNAKLRDFKNAREALAQMILALRMMQKIAGNRQWEQLNNIDHQPFINALNALNQPDFRVLMFLTLVSAVQRNAWPPDVELPENLID